MKQVENPSTFGGALIVSGTTIGAGMLATPLVTAAGGFIPACILYFICWAAMVGMGLIMLEVHLWTGKGSNLITMSRRFLGRPGQWVTSALYIFLFYSLCVAYVAGGASLIELAIPYSPFWLSQLIFLGLLVPFLLKGVGAVDKLNRWLMAFLLGAYVLFIIFGLGQVRMAFLSHARTSYAFAALPVIFTAFSFQGTVPTLCDYLAGDVKKTRRAIVLGTLLTLGVYLLWQLVVLGAVPHSGSGGLIEAMRLGKTAIWALEHTLERTFLTYLGEIFAFAAIATSFLGVNIGLLDFLSDGLKIPKKGFGLFKLAFLAFIPPLALAWIYPDIFIKALGFAGGVGCLLLLGVLPLWMLLVGRIRDRLKPIGSLPKGGFLEAFVGGVLAFVAIVELVIWL